MIFAERSISHEQIAHGVVLALQRVGRRNAPSATEVCLRNNADARSIRIQLLCPPQLVAFLARVTARVFDDGGWPKSLRTNDEHRRAGVHVVGRRAAETGDEGA